MKAILFDMDGVIFDSERAIKECWKEVAEKHGFGGIDEVYVQVIGVNSDFARQAFLDFYGEDFDYDELVKERRELYFSRYSGGKLPLKPGVFELLGWLKDSGWTAVIASSTRPEVVRRQIEDAGLLPYLASIYGGDFVTRSKPAPDIFLKAAEAFGDFPREEIFVVEDSHNGIRAAHAAGMIPIMVPDMLPATEEMKEKARVILPDLFAVRDWLKELK